MSEYKVIYKHYESCYDQHGDTSKGVDWPNPEDAEIRHKIMLEIDEFDTSKRFPTLLDFGCGLAHFYEYIERECIDVIYTGADISQKFIDASIKKFPNVPFVCTDILEEDTLDDYDYIVANGVFTEKQSLTNDQMYDFMFKILAVLFKHCRKGLAFNVMSKNVDWERDDLFHVSMDRLSAFLTENLSRDFVIRHDYKLYEYTVYVYK